MIRCLIFCAILFTPLSVAHGQLQISEFGRGQEEAIKGLRQGGIRFKVGVTDIGFAPDPTKFDLKNLNYVLGARYVSLDGFPITDQHVESAISHGLILHLSLRHTLITDRALKPLGRMVHLEKLDVSDTRITGSEFKHLRNLPLLSDINLSDTPVTEHGLTEVGHFPAFQRREPLPYSFYAKLDISGTKIKNISPLEPAIGIDELNISETLVDDLAPLTKLPNLLMLQAQDTPIDDKSIDALLACRALGSVNLERTKISPKGMLKLINAIKTKGALPELVGIGIDESQATPEVRKALLDIELPFGIEPKVKPKPPEET